MTTDAPTVFDGPHKRSRQKLLHLRHVIIFFVVWIFVFAVPWLGMTMVIASDDPIGWLIVHNSWLRLLPYFVVSFINQFVLLPLFFDRRKYLVYTFGLILLLSAFVFYQNELYNATKAYIEANFPANSAYMYNRPTFITEAIRLNLRVASRLMIAILVIGIGTAYNMLARNRRKLVLARESESMRLQLELNSLKAQISPHFFMNILNNIHSVMDSDTEKAKDMLLELSRMMRYVTYEASLEKVRLSQEIGFISSYISLMRNRYPDNKVRIMTSFPTEEEMSAVQVPPMLFIAFVENAFKHGITYRSLSEINIDIKVIDSSILRFVCSNTIARETPLTSSRAGVGLKNVKRRLEVQYGTAYTLGIDRNMSTKIYTVQLEIQTNEAEMHRNRR